MALRAQESNGARARDTVIPVEDYRELGTAFKQLFQATQDQGFYRSENLTAATIQDVAARAQAAASATVSTPTPRPHGYAR